MELGDLDNGLMNKICCPLSKGELCLNIHCVETSFCSWLLTLSEQEVLSIGTAHNIIYKILYIFIFCSWLFAEYIKSERFF